MRYMLCVDLDGAGAMPLGPTGLEIFGTFVTSVAPFTINAAMNQVLSFTCQTLCSSFLVHLAESCQNDGLSPAEVPGEPSKTFASAATTSATLDTSALRPGRSYEICAPWRFFQSKWKSSSGGPRLWCGPLGAPSLCGRCWPRPACSDPSRPGTSP